MKGLKGLIGLILAVTLAVALGCAGTESRRSTGVYVDDATITTKVKAALAADSMTKALQVDVGTYNGVVQLSGFVDNEATIQKAGEIARGVTGVKEVKNNLTLRR